MEEKCVGVRHDDVHSYSDILIAHSNSKDFPNLELPDLYSFTYKYTELKTTSSSITVGPDILNTEEDAGDHLVFIESVLKGKKQDELIASRHFSSSCIPSYWRRNCSHNQEEQGREDHHALVPDKGRLGVQGGPDGQQQEGLHHLQCEAGQEGGGVQARSLPINTWVLCQDVEIFYFSAGC